MYKFRKYIAYMLCICFINSYLPILNEVQVDADLVGEDINVYVETVNDNLITVDINLKWRLVPAQSRVVIKYHNPDDDSEVVIDNNQVGNTYTLVNLKKDFMYDILVEAYDPLDNQIGTGFTYYTPRITYTSSLVEMPRDSITGGGFNIGGVPRLHVTINIPKVFDAISGTYQYINTPAAIAAINTTYLDHLGMTKNLGEINFKMNISESRDTLSSGSTISALQLKSAGGTYLVNVYGDAFQVEVTDNILADGTIDFDILGKHNITDTMIDASYLGYPQEAFLPEYHILPHDEIFGGSIYYFGLKYEFKDGADEDIYISSAGIPSDLNNIVLYGINDYTYTSPYFEITKDDSDNVYIKVEDINIGGLDIGDITYQIQVNDDKTFPGDWTVKKEINRTFFNDYSNEAIVILTDIGPNNKLYYKIVINAGNESFRVDSYPLEYTVSEDISKPPVPRNVNIIDRVLVSENMEVDGEEITQSSTDVKISWDKPANWSDIVVNQDPDEDIVFHFLINTAQRDSTEEPAPPLISQGDIYGYFDQVYREVLYISARDERIKVKDNSLEITLKGFDLFQNSSYMSSFDVGNNLPVTTSVDLTSKNVDNYPSFLLPNAIYYLKLYTTKGRDRETEDQELKSEYSIIKSFTTKDSTTYNVPLPKLLRIKNNSHETYIEDEETKKTNYIQVQFDKVDVNWDYYTNDKSVAKSVYYDVYMSNRPELTSFKFIGSTENEEGDIGYIGADDETSSSIISKISRFTKGTERYLTFGEKLKENSKYYFIARTRLAIAGKTTQDLSDFTSVLPVTTVRIELKEPDPEKIRPLALADFKVALNSDGTKMLRGNKVTFDWGKLEDGVKYNIIATKEYVEPNKSLEVIEGDQIYKSFHSVFGDVYLDPGVTPYPEEFDFDVIEKKFTYDIEKWLVPNKQYYFSIRAIDRDNPLLFSNWISIPITTKVVESPENLVVLKDAQIGFNWVDEEVGVLPEYYKIYQKKSEDVGGYEVILSSNYSLYKEGERFFARIFNLDYDEPYDFKVTKDDHTITFQEFQNKKTINKKNQIEVKWKGLKTYEYEFSIRNPMDDEYKILSGENLKEYENFDASVKPYYVEKTEDLYDTDFTYYYAVLDSTPEERLEGIVDEDLKSNTKYYIKLRSVNIDPLNTAIVSFSKYVGPSIVRTDFDSDDADRAILKEQLETKFKNSVKKLENQFYWDYSTLGAKDNYILLKGKKIINEFTSSNQAEFVIDLTNISSQYGKKSVFIPVALIRELNKNLRILKLKTKETIISINPNSIQPSADFRVNDLKSNQDVNEIYYLMELKSDEKPRKKLQAGITPISSYIDFKIQAKGHYSTDTYINQKLEDFIHNKSVGLEEKGIAKIKFSKDIPTLDGLMAEVDDEIRSYARELMSNANFSTEKVDIEDLDALINLTSHIKDQKGIKTLYQLGVGKDDWEALYSKINSTEKDSSVDIERTGYYVFAIVDKIGNLDTDILFQDPRYSRLTEKYRIWDVLDDSKLSNLDQEISFMDSIQIYEVIMGQKPNRYLSMQERVRQLGLEDVLAKSNHTHSVEKQLLSYVLIKIYSAKTGLRAQYLMPKQYVFILDESEVDQDLLKYVKLSLDLGLLPLEDGFYFKPIKPVSIKETIDSIILTLEEVGDIK